MVLNSESIKTVSDVLIARGETIAVAESTTGGLISACLLSMPGASAYFLGDTIIYTRVTMTGRGIWNSSPRVLVSF